MKKYFLLISLSILADWSHAQSSIKAIGVLRSDGIVVPLAIFKGNTMQDITERDLLNIEEKRPDWYLITDSIRVVQISTMITYEPFSMVPGIGFISSLVTESIGNFDDEVQGAVYTWLPSSIASFDEQKDIDQRRGALVKKIDQGFKAAEIEVVYDGDRQVIDGVEYANYVPVQPVLRDSLEIEKTVYSASLPGITISYVSAHRWYPKAGCRFKSVFSAWFIEGPSENPSIVRSFLKTDVCDGKSVAGTSRQVQAFELNGKLYSIRQSWGYEGGGYDVMQLEKNNFRFFRQK